MEILIIRLIESLLFPPGLMIAMMLAGAILMRFYFRAGRNLIIGGFILLVIASLPIVPNSIIHLLEDIPALDQAELSQPQAQAIVVLGGGRYADAPEYGHDTVSKSTLERIRYGAFLHHHTGLPVLVTAGSPYNRKVSEAELMQSTLENEFKTEVRWAEKKSKNPWENARFSFELLQEENIKKIYLVTHAWHMPRSQQVFEQAGFEVIPAPTAYTTAAAPLLLRLLPSAGGLESSRLAAHELLGMLWYKLRY